MKRNKIISLKLKMKKILRLPLKYEIKEPFFLTGKVKRGKFPIYDEQNN